MSMFYTVPTTKKIAGEKEAAVAASMWLEKG